MPNNYHITGTITPVEGVERAGLKVHALDRDLPSLERRADSAPEILGEAVTDGEGRFEIAYTLEPFLSGEGAPLSREAEQPSADVSFQVFDPSGRELGIRSLETRDREYRPDQIIFNAPTPLEVKITLVPLPAAGTSEYEFLQARLAPVTKDLPLTELSDEDVVFLNNELGLEQDREAQHRVEWLRRCARLAQETNLPIEALYGWGRKDVPAALAELATVPLKNLPSILEKLVSIPDGELRDALLAAVAENIIPATFRAKVEEIVRRLKRRGQGLHTVNAQLLDEETGAVLVGYTVTTFDQDAGNQNRGADLTDREGKFSFGYYSSQDPRAVPPPRKFSFQIVSPDGEKIPEHDPTVIKSNLSSGEVVSVKVKIPKPAVLPVEEQLRGAGMDTPPKLLEWLRDKGLNTFADIRRKGRLSQSTELPEVEASAIHALESLADLDRLSCTVPISNSILGKGYDCVLAIAEAPHAEFIAAVVDDELGLSTVQAAKLHAMATVQTNLLNHILAGKNADLANGFNLPERTNPLL